jgi:glucose-6-phosphate isomerase
VVGIGGSSMGPRCIAEYSNAQNISFLDNIDSIETENILKKIQENTKVAYLFISKSGTTIEEEDEKELESEMEHLITIAGEFYDREIERYEQE